MRLIPGGKDGGKRGGGDEPPQKPPEAEIEYEFNPSAEGLAIELPAKLRSRAILARQQKRRDPLIAEEQALYLRLKGYTVLEISVELECSTTHVRILIQRATERRKPELDRMHQEFIDEQLMQIDLLWSKLSPRFGMDPDAERVAVDVMARKAKLLGLDKPTKIEQVQPPVPLEAEVDMSLLTVEELRQYREFVSKILERKARMPIEAPPQEALEHQPENGDEHPQ